MYVAAILVTNGCSSILNVKNMDNTNKNIVLIITVLAVVLFVVSYLALQEVNHYLTNKAVDECLKDTKFVTAYTTVDGKNIQVEQPVEEWYKRCIEEKGY